MKFLCISDLHIDYNHNYQIQFNDLDKDVVVLIAGDIASGSDKEADWIKKTFPNNKVIFVFGNHSTWNQEGSTIENQVVKFQHLFPKDNQITFLEKDFIDLGDTIVIGATGWTDFNFFGAKQAAEKSMIASQSGFPDFTYNFINTPTIHKVSNLTTAWMKNQYQQTIDYIAKTIQSHPNKDVVVLTHWPLHKGFCAVQYEQNPSTVFFINHWSQLWHKFPNVKLVVCGHTHEPNIIQVNGILGVCNPLGYLGFEGKQWKPNLIVDSKTQQVFNQQDIDVMGKWELPHKQDIAKYGKLVFHDVGNCLDIWLGKNEQPINIAPDDCVVISQNGFIQYYGGNPKNFGMHTNNMYGQVKVYYTSDKDEQIGTKTSTITIINQKSYPLHVKSNRIWKDNGEVLVFQKNSTEFTIILRHNQTMMN